MTLLMDLHKYPVDWACRQINQAISLKQLAKLLKSSDGQEIFCDLYTANLRRYMVSSQS
jgi:hypothetical protein